MTDWMIDKLKQYKRWKKDKRDRLGTIICAFVGHPPVVNSCFGQLTCARCHAIVGDVLLGGSDAIGKAIVGHECNECTEILSELSLSQRLLTQTKY